MMHFKLPSPEGARPAVLWQGWVSAPCVYVNAFTKKALTALPKVRAIRA